MFTKLLNNIQVIAPARSTFNVLFKSEPRYRAPTILMQIARESSSTGSVEKKLFTPGPLNTSLTVKEAMLVDLGSRDKSFIDAVKYIRSKLLEITGVPASQYTCIPLQGCGTFSVEGVFQTTVPRENGKVLVLENGAYGKRMAAICDRMDVNYEMMSFPVESRVDVSSVEERLKGDRSFTNVAVVHSETSSGVINPVERIGALVKQYLPDAVYFVDAMSSLGAIPLDIQASHIDYVVSSANKCIEGVPGFSYIIASINHLQRCKGQSRSLSLDIFDQYDGLETSGQFRFTPATHSMLAFKQALIEYEQQGGLVGRAKRYKENRLILKDGMKSLGFRELLDDTHEGYIITSYHFPKHDKFVFTTFYTKLSDLGQVIYPGKVLSQDSFRIGNIGHLYPADMRHLLECIKVVCRDMGLTLPLTV